MTTLSGLRRALHWRRLLSAGAGGLLMFGLLSLVWKSSLPELAVRLAGLAVTALTVFGLFEVWPARLPRRLPRWLLQLLGVIVCIPVSLALMWVASTAPGEPPFWRVPLRLAGFAMLSLTGILIGGWTVLSALVVQREHAVREQALSFALERSELERQALDARMRLMRAQVEPHFIFNTLANVRALVDSRSPQASTVLDSLIAYLRAAIPRLQSDSPTLAQEVELVRAYLALMHTRMPDRLSFDFDIAPAALPLRCPPLTLMTLVENAVRHGVDPGEDGGHIRVQAKRQGERLQLAVSDTGVGLQAGGHSTGTGLAALRERLRLVFGETAQLRIREAEPHGVIAEIDIPAHPS